MTNRTEKLRQYITENIFDIKNIERSCAINNHIYAVSQFCAMIALKRGQNAELATIAGMLHDIHTLKTLDSKDHAIKGSKLAKEILDILKITSDEETEIICQAIYNHTNKKDKHSEFIEVLVDADVIQHYLYNIELPISEQEKNRLDQLKKEFGLC